MIAPVSGARTLPKRSMCDHAAAKVSLLSTSGKSFRREKTLLHRPGFSIRTHPGRAVDVGQVKHSAAQAGLHAHLDGKSCPLPRHRLPMLARVFTEKERAGQVDCQRVLLDGRG